MCRDAIMQHAPDIAQDDIIAACELAQSLNDRWRA
jgi:hypothetical protein